MKIIRTSLNDLKNKKIRDNLSFLVKDVQKFFHKINFNEKFFIAGGSVFSTLMNNDFFYDIDVYVYSEDDYKILEEKILIYEKENNSNSTIFNSSVYQTKNAITVTDVLTNKTLQITKYFGNQEDVLEKFDLTSSMVGISSNFELFHVKDYKNIRANLKSVQTETLSRYFKYVNSKGSYDKNQKRLLELLDWILENLFQEVKSCYSDDPSEAIDLLFRSYDKLYNHYEYIHNKIVSIYHEDERIKIFNELHITTGFYIQDACDELNLVAIINIQNKGYLSKINLSLLKEAGIYDRIIEKYPEYFI